MILSQVCLGLAAYLIPTFCKEKQCGQQEVTSLLMYVHGGMWFLLLLVHLYLYHEHRNSLLHGYFAFHLETRTLRRAPLFINSGGERKWCCLLSAHDLWIQGFSPF